MAFIDGIQQHLLKLWDFIYFTIDRYQEIYVDNDKKEIEGESEAKVDPVTITLGNDIDIIKIFYKLLC